jgi:hypothetical protein
MAPFINANASAVCLDELTMAVDLLLGFQPILKLVAWFCASRLVKLIGTSRDLILMGMLFSW